MRKFFICFIFLFLTAQTLPIFPFSFPAKNDTKKPLVLVELFTSINCLNCPPAERALAFLEERQPYPEAEVVTLAYHVDYLNNENWKDEFASPIFTRRQEIYAEKFRLPSIYTPQMIVDGNFQFLGSDLRKAHDAISEAAEMPKADIKISQAENKLTISADNLLLKEQATLYVASVEKKLSPTNKRYGKSEIPFSYNSVVRELKPLTKIPANQKSFSLEIEGVSLNSYANQNKKCVFFVQENVSRKISGIKIL